MTNELPKHYDPKSVEERYKEWWHEKGFFKTKPAPSRDPYTIMMPPPNVTGVLHMGHALQDTIQDTLIRYHRMKGFEAHWQAGKDHAGIATQTVVEREMKKNGEPSRREMGRDKFIERVWKFVEKNRNTISQQKKSLGISPDYSRERFTLDDGLSDAVQEAFVRLYNEGLIYRGPYIVNWSPKLQSAISDEEVDYRDETGNLWYIRYPSPDGGEGVVVATTRPETMLGDTAVMVHPEDERFKHLIGKTVILPLCDREIPVIADDYVDREFGTGVVKVTPAHDPNDFEVGRRHNLDMPVILDTEAVVCPPAPAKYVGLDRFEARKAVVKDLEDQKLLVKTEEYEHSVGYCSRTKVPIEPYLSTQWFLKMKPLAKPAIEAVRNGDIEFVPPRWANVYFQWLENIRDWCISRQLWWGHRIPAFYCMDCNYVHVGSDHPDVCPACGSQRWRQDEDVLDTWFSSWLWTFSTLGWPKQTAELIYYHPTNVLVSGYDIIFFWIARMIMASLKFAGEIPFRQVYITGMIKDKQGRWMSKSLGNGIDPLDMIEQYGADAVRYSLTVLNTVGQDIRLDPSRFEMGRNFANKLWNSFRFLVNRDLSGVVGELGGNVEPSVAGASSPGLQNSNDDSTRAESPGHTSSGSDALEIEDRWIEGRLIQTARELEKKIAQYRLDDALISLYRFIWNDFCDWYIETIKNRIGDDADPEKKWQTLRFAIGEFDRIIHLLHPFMPFITEEIYQTLRDVMGEEWAKQRPESISISEFPDFSDRKVDRAAIEEFEYVRELVSAIRNVRGELQVSPAVDAALIIQSNEPRTDLITREWATISRLAHISGDHPGMTDTKPRASATTLVEGREVYIPLEGLIDLDAERERVTKEIGRIEGMLKGVEKKLSNEKFVANAPDDVVNKEREKQEKFAADLAKLKSHRADLD